MKRHHSKCERNRRAQLSNFTRMIFCLPLYCIARLFDLPFMCQQVYYVHSLSEDAIHPTPDMTPWPLLVLATCFSKKFIPFCRHVRRDVLLRHCSTFENKLKWLASVNRQDDRPNHFGILQIAKKYIDPSWNPKIDLPIHKRAAFIVIVKEVRKVLARSVLRAQHAFKSDDMFIYRVGKWLLQDRGLSMVETDKDGGYAFIDSRLLFQATHNILHGGDYTFGQIDQQNIFHKYISLSKRWADFFKDPGLSGLLCRSLNSGASIDQFCDLLAKPTRVRWHSEICIVLPLGPWDA